MKIKILVVGVGNMGASHAKAYAGIDGFELVGLVARSAPTRDDLALVLKVKHTFSNYKEAINVLKPDAVSINTYPDSHEEIALYALESGAHVFLEKPMATSVEGAQRIKELADRKHLKVVVGYILRQHPSWNKFIELTHELGKPLIMRMNLNQQSFGDLWKVHKHLMRSMSPIVDCGVHYVDIMCQMVKSRPIKVYATGARVSDEVDNEMYNYGMLQVTFEDGSIGWYEAGWGPMMSTTAYFVKDVIGPNGSVSIVEPKHEGSGIENHVSTSRILIHSSDSNKEDQFLDMSEEPDHQELCHLEQVFFLKSILEDINLDQHLNDAIDSLKIVLAADQSVRTGKVIELV